MKGALRTERRADVTAFSHPSGNFDPDRALEVLLDFDRKHLTSGGAPRKSRFTVMPFMKSLLDDPYGDHETEFRVAHWEELHLYMLLVWICFPDLEAHVYDYGHQLCLRLVTVDPMCAARLLLEFHRLYGDGAFGFNALPPSLLDKMWNEQAASEWHKQQMELASVIVVAAVSSGNDFGPTLCSRKGVYGIIKHRVAETGSVGTPPLRGLTRDRFDRLWDRMPKTLLLQFLLQQSADKVCLLQNGELFQSFFREELDVGPIWSALKVAAIKFAMILDYVSRCDGRTRAALDRKWTFLNIDAHDVSLASVKQDAESELNRLALGVNQVEAFNWAVRPKIRMPCRA